APADYAPLDTPVATRLVENVAGAPCERGLSPHRVRPVATDRDGRGEHVQAVVEVAQGERQVPRGAGRDRPLPLNWGKRTCPFASPARSAKRLTWSRTGTPGRSPTARPAASASRSPSRRRARLSWARWSCPRFPPPRRPRGRAGFRSPARL